MSFAAHLSNQLEAMERRAKAAEAREKRMLSVVQAATYWCEDGWFDPHKNQRLIDAVKGYLDGSQP